MRISLLLLMLASCSSDPSVTRDAGQIVDTSLSSDVGADMPTDAVAQDVAMDAGRDAIGAETGDDANTDGLFATTSVVDDRLVLTTNLKPAVEDCPSVLDIPCDDVDQDGLVDAWEDLILDKFRPLLIFDEAETLITDPAAVVVHLGRVTPGRRPLDVDLYLTILYDRDYGSCGTLSSHDGDSERVFLSLLIEPGSVAVQAAYTAAHENTLTDHSMTFSGAELSALEYDTVTPGAARWVVYPSRDKHATYATQTICEGISPIPCFNEACGPDGVDFAPFLMLADAYNAGEPTAPMLEDLSSIGFPDEQAWVDQTFCGGRGRGAICSGSVLSKLTVSPF